MSKIKQNNAFNKNIGLPYFLERVSDQMTCLIRKISLSLFMRICDLGARDLDVVLSVCNWQPVRVCALNTAPVRLTHYIEHACTRLNVASSNLPPSDKTE